VFASHLLKITVTVGQADVLCSVRQFVADKSYYGSYLKELCREGQGQFFYALSLAEVNCIM
jgi:hypothetical protein